MTFTDLHYGELPLLLPNAWDVPSALALLDCGFTAIGTTSFGVASSRGTPDGGRSTKDANVELAAALRFLDCYVSMDIEDGYADDPGPPITSTPERTAFSYQGRQRLNCCGSSPLRSSGPSTCLPFQAFRWQG